MAANSGLKLHGKNGAIYLGGGKIGSGFPQTNKVANKVEWTLNLNRDYVDATVFGDVNKTYLVGLKDIQGTFNGILDVSGDLVVNATNSDTVYIYLYADDRDTHEILVAYGPGLMDASITASNTDAVRVTSNFRASGAWTVFTAGSLIIA
jgi:hypothetical protein